MQPFEYVRVDSIDQAVRELAIPGSRALAGGTTLIDLMKLGVERPSRLVDIGGLPLTAITIDDGTLSIGAMVSNSELAAAPAVNRLFPVLPQAILSGASGQIRNMASVAGNLLQRTRCPFFRSADWPCNKRTSGSGCTAIKGANSHHAVLGVSEHCIAVNPSDLAVALLALDATIVMVGGNGPRRVPIAEFYLLPGDDPSDETVLQPGELITHVVLPVSEPARNSTYLKLRGRASYEFASASVAVALRIEGGVIKDVALALGGLGVKPWRDRTAERELTHQILSRRSVERFCDAILATARPTASNRYKLDLARGAIRRVLLPAEVFK